MFELAVQKVNIDPMFSNVFLKAKIQIVDFTDTYRTGLQGRYKIQTANIIFKLITVGTGCRLTILYYQI